MRRSESDGRESHLIEKDPIYRTHDIFNGVFTKKVRLQVVSDNGASKTNCKGIIWLNFNQPIVRIVEEEVFHNEGQDRSWYRLSCGHIFKSGKGVQHHQGKHVPCFRCGSTRAYRTLEHEWSHIIFKSNPHLYAGFVNKYVEQLSKEGYGVMGLNSFFHLLINAFDDIRVNSLLHYVYAGAAYDIWEKWKGLCEESDEMTNENLIGLIFGVALQANNVYSDGPFAHLIPLIDEATQKVRGKGPANMLIVVRWFLDRCIRQTLNKDQQQSQQGQQGQQPQPSPDGQSSPSQGDAGQGDDQDQQMQQQSGQSPQGQDQDSQDPQQGGQDQQSQQSQAQPQQQGQGSEGGDEGGQQDPSSMPDAWQNYVQTQAQIAQDNDAKQEKKDKNQVMQMLRQSAAPLQKDEDHHVPDPSKEPDTDKAQTAAAINYALGADVDDDQAVDNKIQPTVIDQDVQRAVEQLQNTVREQSSDEHLLSNAKAKIALIDVKPRDIPEENFVELLEEDRIAIQRMRSSFAQVLGSKIDMLGDDGADLDTEAAIQYLVDPSEVDIFEEEEDNKGFAYLILCDMSGSMGGDPFYKVGRGAEMLKQALDYPFVRGELWGFRGAFYYRKRSSVKGGNKQWMSAVTEGGEVWIYRYDDHCQGYTGKTRMKGRGEIEVECGGLTPMNSAVHVAVKYLQTHTPVSMAKRLFLLTDGYPTHTTTSGKSISDKALMKHVEEEIRGGRQRGVETYTFVIGSQIKDQHASQMFGPRRFWSRIDQDHTIDTQLVRVIKSNFVKYLKGI